MTTFKIPRMVMLLHDSTQNSRCYSYAVKEACRLLHRIGVDVELLPTHRPDDKPQIQILSGSLPLDNLEAETAEVPVWDGYRLSVHDIGIAIEASIAKGILNGVYDFAERLGYQFILPGEDGEWLHDEIKALTCGDIVQNPRFPHRGVNWESLKAQIYTVDEWFRFYAKLRFNSVYHNKNEGWDIAPELGMRFETGGHILRDMLPANLFETRPELFRMNQPEDFGGKRTDDGNFCVTNPEIKAIIKDNYRWMDYRWLPENSSPFGEEMVNTYKSASQKLDAAANALAEAVQPDWPDRLVRLTEQEVGRARFEAAELEVMHLQQHSMNKIGKYLASNNKAALKDALEILEKIGEAFDNARQKAFDAHLPENAWYFKNINTWLKKDCEIKKKYL